MQVVYYCFEQLMGIVFSNDKVGMIYLACPAPLTVPDFLGISPTKVGTI